MAGFAFRLQSVLTLRTAAWKECRSALASALAEQAELGARIARLQAEIQDAQRAVLADRHPGRIDVTRLLAASQYDATLREQIDVLRRQHEALADEVARRQQATVEAQREVRILEKLRERQLEQFTQDQAKREANRLDEIGRQRSIEAA